MVWAKERKPSETNSGQSLPSIASVHAFTDSQLQRRLAP
jgi:hypothetical protein